MYQALQFQWNIYMVNSIKHFVTQFGVGENKELTLPVSVLVLFVLVSLDRNRKAVRQ
jgi:hypothetical protein